jgi:putative peptidoglycan lipid II flippase
MGMAAGTTLSRLTGVARVFVLAYVLGFHRLADAYNLANTTPNMLFDIILGGVLSATFIPVFVDRLTNRPEREAWRSISAVLSLAVVVLAVATIACWAGAPWIIDALTALDHAHGVSAVAIGHERAVATSLLRWFVPQVFFYGAISLATALLNTRRRFAAPMWVSIANNVVCIGVLLVFRHVVGPSPSLGGVQLHTGQIILLGLGTTAGVVVQALLLLPSLGRAGLGHVHWRWDPRNEAVRTMARLGGWTFGFVLANQIALFVVLALAGSVGPGSVSAYTYAYTFMQMPYAVVAVSVMSAVAPELARAWSTNDRRAFKRRLHSGLRAELAIIVPAAVGMVLLARPAVALLLGHGRTPLSSTAGTGPALALLAIGLPGFCTFLFVVRVLQSMQRTRVAFWLYVIENGLNIVLALALVHSLGVRGLAISLAAAYTVAAGLGLLVLRSWLGRLGAPGSWQPLRGVVIATVAMGAAVLVVSNLSGSSSGVGLLFRVVASVLTGVVVFAGTAVALASRGRPARPRPTGR